MDILLKIYFLLFFMFFCWKCLFRGNSILLSSQRKTINDRNLTFGFFFVFLFLWIGITRNKSPHSLVSRPTQSRCLMKREETNKRKGWERERDKERKRKRERENKQTNKEKKERVGVVREERKICCSRSPLRVAARTSAKGSSSNIFIFIFLFRVFFCLSLYVFFRVKLFCV